MSNDFTYINDNIRLLLNYNKMTQLELCKKIGMSEITFRRRINSDIPKWTMIEAFNISKVFNLSVDEIFFTKMIPNGIKKII